MGSTLRSAVESIERYVIAQALRANGGCRKAAAKALGVSRSTLFNKMRKYNLLDDRRAA